MTTLEVPVATVPALPVEPVATAFVAPLATTILPMATVQYIAPPLVVSSAALVPVIEDIAPAPVVMDMTMMEHVAPPPVVKDMMMTESIREESDETGQAVVLV